MTPAEIDDLERRYPAEFKPNPYYRYEPPREVVIDGVKCIQIDGASLALDMLGRKTK